MKEAINIKVQVSTCRYIEHLHPQERRVYVRIHRSVKVHETTVMKEKNKENKNLLDNNHGR